MTTKFTKEQLIAQARENVKTLKMAAVQNAFKEIRPAIELDLRLAEIVLAALTVVPDEAELKERLKSIWWRSSDLNWMSDETASKIVAACRASMLQGKADDCDGEPTDDERIMAIEGILPGSDEPVAWEYWLISDVSGFVGAHGVCMKPGKPPQKKGFVTKAIPLYTRSHSVAIPGSLSRDDAMKLLEKHVPVDGIQCIKIGWDACRASIPKVDSQQKV